MSDLDSAGHETVPETRDDTFKNETVPNDIIFDSDFDFCETASKGDDDDSAGSRDQTIDGTCDCK